MRTHTHTWVRELEIRTVAGQHTDPVGLHRAGAYVHGPQPYGVELVLIKYWVYLKKGTQKIICLMIMLTIELPVYGCTTFWDTPNALVCYRFHSIYPC